MVNRTCFLILLLLCFACTTEQKALYDYDVEQRLSELEIELETPKVPLGINIELANQSGNLIYLSGNGPMRSNGDKVVGKVGQELTIEEGYAAARLTAINHLSVLKAKIGDLNKVVKIVKVLGLVNAPPEFTEHPAVINGYTDLMIEVFGDRGRHARSAMGMGSLPWNLACEIETIVEIRD